MKYDVLNQLREYLMETRTPNTAKKYHQAVKGLLRDIQFNTGADLTPDQIEARLQLLKTRNDVSAAKNGLKAMVEIYPDLPFEKIQFATISKSKRNRLKRRFKPVKLDSIKRRINSLRDVEQKTAFRLQLISGLRISELADLEKEDISIDGPKIVVHVRNGKGGKQRKISCLSDPYTTDKLQTMLQNISQGQKLFPSAKMLQNTATKRNFETHDLRRAFAKCFLREKSKEMQREEAKACLMQAMGHTDWRTTRRYLRRKIEI